jgi:hypothetical protein
MMFEFQVQLWLLYKIIREMLFVPTIFAICTHPRDFTHPHDRIPYENTISM